MLSDETMRWALAAHEAGHAVVGAALSIIVSGVSLDRSGGATHLPGERVWNEADALRMATLLWAGRAAERLLLPRSLRRQFRRESDRNSTRSDERRIIGLAAEYGGTHTLDCLSWSLRCRSRALAILAMNLPALRETAERIYRGHSVHFVDPPLLHVRRMR